MENHFLFITFGDSDLYHRQTNFAVISLLANLDEPAAASISVYTDKPAWYEWLGDRVTVIVVDDEQLRDWRGPYDHLFRIKINAILDVLAREPGNVIYLDSDVVHRGGSAPLFSGLGQDNCFMDGMHYRLGDKGGRAGKILQGGRGKKYGKFVIGEESAMWNAGVVAVPAASGADYLADALESMDAMCADGLHPTLLEQFALSLSLDQYGKLRSSKDWFTHYWGNKLTWNALIATFFAEVHIRSLSVEEAVARFGQVDLGYEGTIGRTRFEKLVNSLNKRLSLDTRDERVMAHLRSILTPH